MYETRTSKGFNKSEMARQLNVATQLYGQYEAGKVEPKTDFRLKFEKIFGVSLIENENNNSIQTIQKKPDNKIGENTGVQKNNNPVTLNLNDQATMIVEFISLLREANSNMKIIAESNRTLAFTIKSISGNSKNQEEAESMEGKRQLKVKGK